MSWRAKIDTMMIRSLALFFLLLQRRSCIPRALVEDFCRSTWPGVDKVSREYPTRYFLVWMKINLSDLLSETALYYLRNDDEKTGLVCWYGIKLVNHLILPLLLGKIRCQKPNNTNPTPINEYDLICSKIEWILNWRLQLDKYLVEINPSRN